MRTIRWPVGVPGVYSVDRRMNDPADVRVVQELLLQSNVRVVPRSGTLRPSPPSPRVTGICDENTIAHITAYQEQRLPRAQVVYLTREGLLGVVLPDSMTLYALNGMSGGYEPESGAVREGVRSVIEWSEVYSTRDALSPPEWSLAGRRDDVPGGVAESVVAVVNFAQNFINDLVINQEIERRLRGDVGSEAARLLTGHRTGGVLAVARVIYRHEPSLQVGPRLTGGTPSRVSWVLMKARSQVYSEPYHAVAVFRDNEMGTSRGMNTPLERYESDRYRYFWATWVR